MNTVKNQISSEDKNEFILLRYDNKNLKEFNRHTILHGQSLDYGIKENAIKSILLLDFVRGLKDILDIK